MKKVKKLPRQRNVVLTLAEKRELRKEINGQGGFQSLMTRLRKNLNKSPSSFVITGADVERISRYAFDYANGGWQDRLVAIFGRTLGPNLGRNK